MQVNQRVFKTSVGVSHQLSGAKKMELGEN